MKKYLFVLMVTLVFALSACSSKPFVGPAGTVFTEDDRIMFYYDNGETETLQYELRFSQNYYFFTSDLPNNYDFTSINNYKAISDDFKDFLDEYKGYIVRKIYVNESVGDTITLSKGASSTNFNSIDVSVDGKVWDVDDYIAVENGVRIVFSYTEFYHDGELIIVPFHLAFLTADIHELTGVTYLGEDNEYAHESAVYYTYKTHVVPLPPRSGFLSTYRDGTEIEDLGFFHRVVPDISNHPAGVVENCSVTVTEDCFETTYTSASGFIYDTTVTNVIVYYTELYNGHYIGDDFVFEYDGIQYVIVMESSVLCVDSQDVSGTCEDVVTYDISVY
jgi:hypothetical protein